MSRKKKIAETFQGYAIANEFLEEERIERLSDLSIEDSRVIFSELVKQGLKTRDNHDQSEQILAWRLDTLIVVRQAFKKLAQVKGWI